MKKNIYLSVLLTSISLSAIANPEVTGKFTFESARYTSDGTTVGSATTNLGSGGAAATTATSHGTENFKNEISARIYVDGSLDNGDAYHAELQAFSNSKAVNGLDNNESYTQRDPLRELYIDTSHDDWQIRAGKQQVVWGTIDGMKLLDLVNPTDYTEMAQNQMEDSRIPVWMLNAEKIQEDGSSIQIIASQPRENVFSGLDRNISTQTFGPGSYPASAADGSGHADSSSFGHHTGSPFVLKGVDTITGKYNGFLNITPDIGGIAGKFAWGFGKQASLWDPRMLGFTVGGFEGMTMGGTTSAAMPVAMKGQGMLCTTANSTASGGDLANGDCPEGGVVNADYAGGGNYFDLPDAFQSAINGVAANLSTTDIWTHNPSTGVVSKSGVAKTQSELNSDSAWLTLANSVTGQQMLAMGFQPGYNTSLADLDSIDDTAFDYMGNATFRTFDTFQGAKSQYVFDMPSDADIDLAARYRNTTEDGVNYSLVASYNYDKNPVINLSWRGNDGGSLTQSTYTNTDNGLTYISLADASGQAYGGKASAAGDANYYPTLRFTQTLERAMNLGGSFDASIDTDEFGPVVIRGEAVYQKDVYSPVINKSKLAIGDLLEALKMEKGDKLKYAIGIDITALTNMMVSLQFIQERNLDFVDGAQSNGRYTADFASMHLTNGFNKALKNKEFYTLYLSKPFGSSDQHRWNNILILEENGGRWNRLDAEYTIDDNTVASVEYNKYWGDKNTQFGQLENASNIQVGLKYSF